MAKTKEDAEVVTTADVAVAEVVDGDASEVAATDVAVTEVIKGDTEEVATTDADGIKKSVANYYQVQWLLSHDGHNFNAGEIIDLTDDDLATNKTIALLESGVIIPYIEGE